MTQFLIISSSLAGVKKATLASIIAISWLSLIAPPLSTAALAANSANLVKMPSNTPLGTCPASGISSPSGAINLASNCKVAGNITLSGTASLTMTGAVLKVKGNIVLNDQAQLTVTNGGLAFLQTYFGKYSVTLNNMAKLSLNNSSVVTSGISPNHLSMTLYAYNTSVVDLESSTLTTAEGSWVLGSGNYALD
jgi:hypothetical protein